MNAKAKSKNDTIHEVATWMVADGVSKLFFCECETRLYYFKSMREAEEHNKELRVYRTVYYNATRRGKVTVNGKELTGYICIIEARNL